MFDGACIRCFLGRVAAVGLLLTFSVSPAPAGEPYGAYYSADTSNIFWFIQVTDTHIGARGDQDHENLLWVVTTGKSVINPDFIVVSGDLTDSTNGNLFGYPNGPYQAEWDEYRKILSGNVDANNFYDIPGNHDAYNDQYFDYYLANSIQGQATSNTQLSWTRAYPFGTYHFLGVNTADNTGDPFSLFWPWGDYAGLDINELTYIEDELTAHEDADLSFVFGHHPITDTGVSDDTWLYYGAEEFFGLLDSRGASLYGYGHTHRYSEALFEGDDYTGYAVGGGFVYLNVDSLGKSTEDNFSVIAVDCNGISTKTQSIGTWPLVMITAPVDDDLGGLPNPYAYTVPDAVDNPIRALVFDEGTVSLVQYRIDGGQWYAMSQVSSTPSLWEAVWDNSGAMQGLHTIEVQATGSNVRSDVITVAVAQGNAPPVASDDAYSVSQDATLTISAPGLLGNDTDPDNDPLSAVLNGSVSHGVLALSPDGSFTYTPTAGYSGTDTFTYKANDGTDDSNVATVTITVNQLVTNTPPLAVDDAYSVNQDTGLSVTAPGVLGNDTDVDDDPLTAVLNGSVSHGVLALSPEGSFSYTPTAGYSGTDTFTYKANDGTDDSNVATVTITVTNDQPAACDYADKQSCQSDVDCAWEGNPRTGFCRETEPSCIPDSESESSCDDGIDNDCDTLVDGDDPDCSGSSVVCGDLTADGYDACKAEPTCRWSKKDERCVTK